MRRRILLGLMVLLSFGGCRPAENAAEAGIEKPMEKALPAAAVSVPQAPPEQDYALYIYTEDYQSGRYEPERGAYIGADISADQTVLSDIGAFEEKTQAEHALYANTMKLGGDYPYEWLLQCVAKQKTPVLTIEPPDSFSPFQLELLEKTAREAGALNIPMFVQFYPYSSDKGYKPERYVAFFRQAQQLFQKHVPAAAMVWGVAAENVYDCFAYYPGDSSVDWVAVTLTQKVGEFGDALYRPGLKDIDYFYFSFQKQKPIMISGLSVSHYSTESMAYYTKEAAAEINKIYKAVADRYPRIKAVIYKSYNEIDEKEAEEETAAAYQNYLITEDPFLLEAYADGIGRDRYVSAFSQEENGEIQYDFMRSPFAVYEMAGEYYISEKSLQYDLGLVGLSLLNDSETMIGGEKYFPLAALEEHMAFRIEIDAAKELLILEKE